MPSKVCAVESRVLCVLSNLLEVDPLPPPDPPVTVSTAALESRGEFSANVEDPKGPMIRQRNLYPVMYARVLSV